jgi:hypothetical protein
VPIPTNDSEQLLFSNLFATLVRIDCRGQVRPGLAVTWRAEPARSAWIFTLGGSAGSVDQSEVAERVVSSWKGRWAAVAALGVESTSIQGDSRLSVVMSAPLDSLPLLFADPTLAMSHQTDSASWRIDGGTLRRADSLPGLVDFRVTRGVDPRDAFDAGADLMVTRDPELLDYAARRPELVTSPLPWSRSYVLLQPAAAGPLDKVIGDAERRSLARDAVSADARAAQPPFWWDEVTGCRTGAAAGPTPVSSRVVYLRGDVVARGLAERLVALAGPGTELKAAALESADFTAVLRTGSEHAYVVALPRHTLAPCRESAALPNGARIQPLIDTRAYAVVRRGAPSITVEWQGTVRVAPR